MTETWNTSHPDDTAFVTSSEQSWQQRLKERITSTAETPDIRSQFSPTAERPHDVPVTSVRIERRSIDD